MGPAIEISEGSAPVVLNLFGGNALSNPANTGDAATLVKILNTGLAQSIVNIHGLWSGLKYPVLIDDQRNGVQVTSTDTTQHGFLNYCAGKYVRFDKNGFQHVP
jgi:hypothetical protein